MRAAVLVDVGRIEVRDIPRADPSPTEIVVRVQAVGMCGTDLHIVAGQANYNRDAHGRLLSLAEAPQILGHEVAGVVEEVGRDVRDLGAGDRVIIDQGRTCVSDGRRPVCEYCLSGDSHQCENYREHGLMGLPGGFAEFVTIPAVNAVALTSGLAPEHAALTEPLGCVHHSIDMLERSGSRYRINASDHAVRTVMVCGGGPAGLLFLQYLRAVTSFDGMVIVSEPNALKRSLAERWGAVTVDPTATDVVGHVWELTLGRGVELLIEAAGSGAVFRSMPGLIRKQGSVLLYGHGQTGTELSVLNHVQFREPTFVSPIGASGGHDATGRPVTYRRALELLEQGIIDVVPLVTHRYTSLDDVPRAFAGDHRLPDYVKGVLVV